MATCFVIQPFDKSKFDKRYDGIIAPAIRGVGLVPYRVDRDPTVSIPIDRIEEGIKTAKVCLADITTNNPNVWFELGFAIASQCDVLLLCSDERDTPYPFDIQRFHIIKYLTDGPQDFEELRRELTARLQAKIERGSDKGVRRGLDLLDNQTDETLENKCKIYHAKDLPTKACKVSDDPESLSGQSQVATLRGFRNHLIYGPYEELDAGNYIVFFKIRASDDLGSGPILLLDVVASEEYTYRVVSGKDFDTTGKYRTFAVRFSTAGNRKIEYRVLPLLGYGRYWVDYVARGTLERFDTESSD